MAWNPHAAPWGAWDAAHMKLCQEDESSETAISSSAEGLRFSGPPPGFHPSKVVVQSDNPLDGYPCSMSTTHCDSPQNIITSSDASCCSFPPPFRSPHTTTASAHGLPCSVLVQSGPPQTIATPSGNFARFFVKEGESPQATVSSSIEHLSSAAWPHECPLTSPACQVPSSLALTSPPMSGSVLSGPVRAETDVFSKKCSTVDWNDTQQGHLLPVAGTSSFLSEPNGAPSLHSHKLFAMDWKDDVSHPGTVKDTDAKLTKLKSHSLKQHQTAMSTRQMADKFNLTKQSECNSSTQPEEQGGASLHAVQDVKCRYKDVSTQPEEQRGSSLHAAQDVKSIALSLEEQHSSTVTGSAGSGDSLIGLHLGKRTYFQDATSGTVIKTTQQKSSPTPKKCRAFAMQTPRCQVQGCNVELTSAKDYLRKHKVCDSHSKAVKVTVANQDQRFCQQCSRFHLLAEFDETKRSCRRRLAGHNERRRKPQPDPLALHARLQSSFQVWPYLHHSRVLGLPSLYQDSYNMRSSGSWPRTSSVFEDRTSCLQAPSTELQLNFKGVLHPHSGSHPLLVLQSPTEMIPFDISHSHANENYLIHQYLSDFDGSVSNGIPLASSSSSEAGVLSGYEATEMVARVAGSGCALSLLSPQTRGLYTPNAVSLDWLGGSNNGNGQFVNEENVHQHSSQRGQHQLDYGCIPERSHFEASACSLPTNWIDGLEKNNLESALEDGFDGGLGVQNHLLLSAFPEQDRGNTEDGKQTIDLMQMLSSQSQHETTQGVSLPFQLGGGVFGDLQFGTYGSAF